MLRFYVTNDDGESVVIVGMTRGNVERLTAGQPMRIPLEKPVDKVWVVFGETKPDIIRDLEAAGGVAFTAEQKASAERDPL